MTRMWTPDVIRFALLVGVSAAWCSVQLRLWWRAFRAQSLSVPLRVACLFPPVSVYVAFRKGARLSALLWLGLLIVYVALRL